MALRCLPSGLLVREVCACRVCVRVCVCIGKGVCGVGSNEGKIYDGIQRLLGKKGKDYLKGRLIALYYSEGQM